MFIYIKTSVIGTGFVGLITGNCLGETGNEVLCIDIDQAKVEKLQSGIVPIYESHSDVLCIMVPKGLVLRVPSPPSGPFCFRRHVFH